MSEPSHVPCIILTGMHRSATSAAAAVLQSAGVYIGELLFGPNEGNPYGYFEDADFVLLHEEALKSLGLSKEGWVAGQRCSFREPVRAKARELIEARRRRGQPWGWKDPRTVLFLDEWAALLPEALFVFAFRAPWAVLDSLFRRFNPGDEVFETSPELAAEVYSHYARTMLKFAREKSDRVLFLAAEDIVSRPHEWVTTLRAKWGVPLKSPDTSMVDPSGMKQEKAEYRQRLLERYFPETMVVYRELLVAAGKTTPTAETATDGDFQKWVLQDWAALRRVEQRLKKTRQEIEVLRDEAGKLARERDEWRQRAETLQAKYNRFHNLVANSIFWRARRVTLKLLARFGLRAHLGEGD